MSDVDVTAFRMDNDLVIGKLVKEPDEMGAWSDCGSVVSLPRSLYPKRSEAIAWAVSEWRCHWLDIRCLSRWLRYVPNHPEGDWWEECEATDEGAFRVWHLEAALPSAGVSETDA